MLGPAGVDPVNSSNEVVPSVVWCNENETLVVDADEVEDCATVGLVKCDWAALLKECEIAVHYEVGYMTAGSASNDVWAAYKAMTALCGCVGGHVTTSLCED